MADFESAQLTNLGRTLLAKTYGRKILKFTRACAGDGELPEGQDIEEMTAMIHPVADMGITAIDAPSGTGEATIELILINEILSEFLLIREVGLFAEDPDTKQEVLYAYLPAGEHPQPMPAYNGRVPVIYRLGLETVIGNAVPDAVYVRDPAGVTEERLNMKLDTLRRDYKCRDMSLQRQIDQLAEASISKALSYAEKQLGINQEEAE